MRHSNGPWVSTHALERRFRFLGVFCFAGLPFVDEDMASNVGLETGENVGRVS